MKEEKLKKREEEAERKRIREEEKKKRGKEKRKRKITPGNAHSSSLPATRWMATNCKMGLFSPR